jgi:hypothetical protein
MCMYETGIGVPVPPAGLPGPLLIKCLHKTTVVFVLIDLLLQPGWRLIDRMGVYYARFQFTMNWIISWRA